ncbi:helix-turn-helix family protein [[Clostridium] bifermentans ATCC 638]|uniref:Helix-turn-helix family protein n=1 Tax=Paraclostridium bifermentans ATCC 638 = DSM 14991 TaxID=1233171 RepID=T4VGT7_PARBF|nr:helix-turn-helix transcriptional regulator [Paraclostridium bifermentans]EQK39976.1 helix-turn-helix family protein [[Clostridium] bifermentans ATCC 638] [Paraclostridium bifermentans ATCC 638 = DSM 14991]RIZ57398.1 XRE family transcriptional regulator [Paraclostridium bifermentans]UAG19924.1 helix-turn-helix domain-containing protein [Paraclostridium bifermentans]
MNEFNLNFRDNFANNLKYLRKNRNISKKKLADDIGLSRATLTHYENGNRLPEFESIVKLALYFECSIDELIFHGTPIDIGKLKEIDTISDIDNLISDKELLKYLFDKKSLLEQYSEEINDKLSQINIIVNIINSKTKNKNDK